MKTRRHTITLITALLIFSLVGLVFLQYYLLTDAIALKEQTFRQNVHAAMNSVAERLEASEAAGRVFQFAMKPQSNTKMKMITIDINSNVKKGGMVRHSSEGSDVDGFATEDSLVVFAGLNIKAPPIWCDGDSIKYFLDKTQPVKLRVYDALGREDTIIVNKVLEPGEYSIPFDKRKYAHGEFFYKLWLDSSVFTIHVTNGDFSGVLPNNVSYEKRRQLVGKVVDNLVVGEHQPIERRINQPMVDSLLKQSLSQAGISLPYAYGVLSERSDSLTISEPAQYGKQLHQSEYKARLFPGDFLASNNQLVLFFPGQNMFILKQVGPQLVLSVMLISVLVICFVYVIRTITKQKEFAVRLTDFINNMTHEFKTPISTISVAAETIMREDVMQNKEKVERYGMVIHDENLRMKHQVDKILQMAVIEEGDYELKLLPVDAHELIAKAVENIALHIDARGGNITCSFEANNSIVYADVVHLSNIIHNILENANKYSPENPKLFVSTKNNHDMFLVVVQDNGIGINKEYLKNVFDKYYRVPTGNLHDVKGFGLGLSYVKLMTEAHNGTVAIESEPGTGTTVTITIPVYKEGV